VKINEKKEIEKMSQYNMNLIEIMEIIMTNESVKGLSNLMKLSIFEFNEIFKMMNEKMVFQIFIIFIYLLNMNQGKFLKI
jgi:hypothetical protein